MSEYMFIITKHQDEMYQKNSASKIVLQTQADPVVVKRDDNIVKRFPKRV